MMDSSKAMTTIHTTVAAILVLCSVCVEPALPALPPPPPATIKLLSLTNGLVTIAWENYTDFVHQLQVKANLSDGEWKTILGDVTSSNQIYTKSHRLQDSAQRFFRVVTLGDSCCVNTSWPCTNRWTCQTNSYYAGDSYPSYPDGDQMIDWNRAFDEVLINFHNPYTNSLLATPSGIILQHKERILTEGSWWVAVDGISSSDRALDLTNLLSELNAQTNVLYAYPVYRLRPSGWRGWGGERLYLGLHDSYSINDFKNLLDKYSLFVLEEDRRINTYLLKRLKPKEGDVFQICNAFVQDQRVRYAEPLLAREGPSP